MNGIFIAVAILAGQFTKTHGERAAPELLPAPKEVRMIVNGDLVGIFVDKVVGEADQKVPSHMMGNPPVNYRGYPFLVSEEGTITLPYVEPIKIAGLTEREALAKLRDVYGDSTFEPIKDKMSRFILSLYPPK